MLHRLVAPPPVTLTPTSALRHMTRCVSTTPFQARDNCRVNRTRDHKGVACGHSPHYLSPIPTSKTEADLFALMRVDRTVQNKRQQRRPPSISRPENRPRGQDGARIQTTGCHPLGNLTSDWTLKRGDLGAYHVPVRRARRRQCVSRGRVMAWRLRGDPFSARPRRGDNMADYEQVTQDISEGFSRIAANKGDKSVEIIMKEILEVFAVACEQNNLDKQEFMQAFFEWYTEKRS
jgi:hypothetical protein